MNRRTFIQGLIGLASMPMIAKYINVFKPAAVREGITKAADNTMQKGIEFYEAVIKKVIDEGTVVSESNRVRTYKHPDKPEIDVEVNLTSGDTSVNFESDYGFKAGAEITTDMEAGPASKELMEGELVYRGHGPEGDYSKDWEEGIIEGGITNLEDWIKRKRGYAAGGRVGRWMGGPLSAGKSTLREMLRHMSKGSSHGKSGAEMLKMVNPKHFSRHLEDPNLLFMKGSSKEGMMATDIVKDMVRKVEADRAMMIDELIQAAKNIRKADKSIEQYRMEMIEAMMAKGADRATAESLATMVAGMAEGAAGKRPTPKLTDEGILELETIHKNLLTKGRQLNAAGGRVGLRYGGDTMGGPNDRSNRGRQDPMGGRSDFTASQIRSVDPSFRSNNQIFSGGGGGNKNPKTYLPPVTLSIGPKYTPLGPVPRFADLNFATKYGILNLRTDLLDVLKDQELDSELSFTGNVGPVNINAITDLEGNNSLGLGFSKGNFSAGAFTDFDGNENFGVNYSKTFADGGRVGMWKGGMPKGLWAAIRSIWNKYGEDAITTANEIKRPQNVVEAEETAQAIKDFNARNPNIHPDSEIGRGIRLEEQGRKLADAASDAEVELRGQFPFASEDEIKAMLPKGVKMSTESVEIWENPVKIREAVDDIFPTGDYKYDAQMAAEALVENNPQAFNNMLYEDLDQATQMKVYGAVVDVVMGDRAKMLQMKKLSKPTKTLEGIEKTGTINISDPNVAEEFARFMRETDPKGAKKVDEIVELMNFDPKGRKKNAKGGHIKDDADVSLTIIEIPDISESGVESLFKRR